MTNREYLDKVLRENAKQNWWQPDLFSKHVRHLLSGSLEILLDPPIANENYNCFMYALGLHSNQNIREESKGFIYDTFFSKLLDANELEIINNPLKGDYVLYKDEKNHPDILTHIGVISGNSVISKWSWGPLIKHDLLDVPQSYGEDIFYVRSISQEESERLYAQYKKFNVPPTSSE